MRTAFVTGSSGLIGSEMVAFLDERGWAVHGVDNNMRRTCYITNLRRFRTDYPEWEVTVDLDAVFASFRRHGSDIAKEPLLRALPQPR